MLLAASSLAQQKTAKELDELSGPVHTVTTESATLTLEAGELVEGPKTTLSFITYGTDGNDGRSGGTAASLSPIEPTRKLNEKGEEIERVYKNADETIARKTVFSRDGAGRVIEETDYKPDGSLMSRAVFTYDGGGNTDSMSFYNSQNVLTRKLTWVFDKKGNRTEWTESNLRGKEFRLFCKITSVYNDKNLVIEETQDGNPEGVITKKVFSYEYDATGNWIKRDRAWWYTQSGQTQLGGMDRTYRTISYY